MIRPRAERRRHSCQPSTEPNQTVGELKQLANVVIVVVVDLNSVLGQARHGKAKGFLGKSNEVNVRLCYFYG